MSLRSAKFVLLAGAVAATAFAATDLENLAALHGTSGDEGSVAEYVVKRLSPRARIDNTGSVTISFGEGGSSLLIAAGLDEPGFAVSEITDDGYLRLQRLADPAPNYQFDSYFTGRPVRVQRFGREFLPAVIAAPSVHFASDRGYASSARGVDNLYVDLGASSRQEAEDEGVAVLDRVTLEREPFRMGEKRVTSAWISSRAGAAVLLALAERLADDPPNRKVSLAFVSQQYYHNAGLAHALVALDPAEAIVIRPGGGVHPGLAGAAGYSSELTTRLLEQAESRNLRVDRASIAKLSFGPFTPEGPWPNAEAATLLTVGVENPDSPVETVDFGKLDEAATLLAIEVGLEPGAVTAGLRMDHPFDIAGPPGFDAKYDWEDSLRALTLLSGVSEDEERVRDEIQRRLPTRLASASGLDERGNLVVRVGPDEPPAALFIAHMDEVGFGVTRSSSDGSFSLTARGGVSEDLFAYMPLIFQLKGEPTPGLMARFGSGLAAGEMAEGVTATVPKGYVRLIGTRVNARSLDDRAGCAVLLHALGQIADAARRAKRSVWFVFSVEEETGLLGAQALATKTAPHRVYAVDSLVTSDSPVEPTRIANLRLGDGAAVRAIDNSGITSRVEVERVAKLAAESGIPLQVGITAGGNDGSKFVPRGSTNVPLSFPLRYSHTAAEVADLKDIDALARLTIELARDEMGIR